MTRRRWSTRSRRTRRKINWSDVFAEHFPEAVREHRFHPERRWRFDFAWPEQKLAVEIDGAVYAAGRHTRGSGFRRDAEKLNTAVLLGWRLLRCSTTDLERRWLEVAAEVRTALGVSCHLEQR